MQSNLLPNLLGTQSYTIQELADNVPDDLIEGQLHAIIWEGGWDGFNPLRVATDCFCVTGWMLYLAGLRIDEIEALDNDIYAFWIKEVGSRYGITEQQIEFLLRANDDAEPEERQASVRAALLELIGVSN